MSSTAPLETSLALVGGDPGEARPSLDRMPEGDTIRTAASRVGAALSGRGIEAIETPHPRLGEDGWPDKLAGGGARALDAHGKHLMLRFEGAMSIHSHLRMTGAW